MRHRNYSSHETLEKHLHNKINSFHLKNSSFFLLHFFVFSQGEGGNHFLTGTNCFPFDFGLQAGLS